MSGQSLPFEVRILWVAAATRYTVDAVSVLKAVVRDSPTDSHEIGRALATVTSCLVRDPPLAAPGCGTDFLFPGAPL